MQNILFLLFLNCRTSYINIALDIGLIDEVNDEIQELEKKLNVYVNLVLSDKERPQSTAQTLSPSTMKGESFPRQFQKYLCLQSCQSVLYPTILLHVVMYDNTKLSIGCIFEQ